MTSVSTDRRFGVNAGMAIKVPCKVATTANITLSGEQTIDGVACVEDDRVLVRTQTTASENGIYYVKSSAWERTPDFDDQKDVTKGTLIPVNQGSIYANCIFNVDTAGMIIPGTTSITFNVISVAALTGLTATANELNYTDVTTPGIAQALKAVVLDANKSISDLGDVAIGGVARSWATMNGVVDVGDYSALVESSNSNMGLALNARQNSGWKYIGNSYASLIDCGYSSGNWIFYTAPSGAAGGAITWTERFKIDNTGVVTISATPSVEGGGYLNMYDYRSSGNGVYFLSVSNFAYNTSSACVWLGKNSSTSRSINAAGTINASGADYAEYERKHGTCDIVAKGDVIGFDEDGLIVDRWSQAKTFGIKSTDPSYVGGDSWGSAEALGIAMPKYPRSEDVTVIPPEESDYNAVLSQMPQIPEEGDEAEIGAYHLEVQRINAEVEALRHDHETAMVKYRESVEFEYRALKEKYDADMKVFNQAVEVARAHVDRIAYSGKVPVNIIGQANVGDFIVPVDDGRGGITGVAVADSVITFAQYLRAVGQVKRILPDGRPEVVVKKA